jgi:hypothetical protein
MNKKLIFVFLLVTFIIFPLSASDERIHNQQMRQVLFGYTYRLNENGYRNLEALEKSIYLCIDLFNGYTYNRGQAQRYLDELRKFGVRNLPGLNTIDFTAGAEHQRYTHRGWDWTLYPRDYRGYNFQQIWNIRQQRVYLAPIDRIFNFRRNEMEKRDSFAALLYYVHILGDHIGDKKRSYMDRIPISPRPDYRFNRSGENSNNPTIYTELLYHLPRLFREQTSSVDYLQLIGYLESNKNREFPTGTVISDEEYSELQHFAQETLDKMIRYIPRLLQNERFFTRTFRGN